MIYVTRKESFLFREEYWLRIEAAFQTDKEQADCLIKFCGCALGRVALKDVPEKYRPLISEFIVTVETDYARYLKRKKARE